MKYRLSQYKQASGQTLIILLLIMVVTLTVGLSVVSRAITGVKETTTTERSTRAFSAAEAGVESVLRQDLTSPSLSGPGATPLAVNVGAGKSTVTVTKTGGSTPYQPVKPVQKDDVLQVNLDITGLSNPADGVRLYWTEIGSTTDPQSCSTTQSTGIGAAALEVVVVDGPPTYNVHRYNYNPPSSCSGSTLPYSGNNFTDAVTGGGSQFLSKTTDKIPITAGSSGTKIMRIRPLYGSAAIRIVPVRGVTELAGNIPTQSYKIRSEGTENSSNVKRVVEVEKSSGGLPSIFDYVLFNNKPSCSLSKSGSACP